MSQRSVIQPEIDALVQGIRNVEIDRDHFDAEATRLEAELAAERQAHAATREELADCAALHDNVLRQNAALTAELARLRPLAEPVWDPRNAQDPPPAR